MQMKQRLDKRKRILVKRIRELESAIRKHRDQRGDDRCWMDDEELYKILPEGYTPPERDTSVELGLCKKFIETRHNPKTEYISPQREIERFTGQMKAIPTDNFYQADKYTTDDLVVVHLWKNGKSYDIIVPK